MNCVCMLCTQLEEEAGLMHRFVEEGGVVGKICLGHTLIETNKVL